MSKTILIQFKGEDNVSKTAKNVENSVKRVGAQSAATAGNIDKSWRQASGSLESLGSQFRYMSLAAGIAAAGAVTLAKSFVNAAREAETARLKLGVFAVSAGEDMDKVNAAATRLYSTGLLSLEESATSLANLLATGIGLERATNLLDRFLDSASVAKENLTDTMGQAVVKASLGFRIFAERQIDAVGVNFLLADAIKNTGKELFGQGNNLTTAQRHLALYTFLMRETERTVGAADLATQTFTGTLSRLGATSQVMKAAIGNTLVPIIGTLAEKLTAVSTGIGGFAREFPELTAVMVSGITVTVTLAAALAGLGAIVPLLTTGFKALNFAATALVTKGLVAVLSRFAIAAVAIGALTFGVIKATGGWDKWTESMKNLSNKIAETIKPISQMDKQMEEMNAKLARQLSDIAKGRAMALRDFQEGMAEWVRDHDKNTAKIRDQIEDLERDYSAATDKIRDSFSDAMSDLETDHARKTEDIQQQLDEEVSKGVWADQTRIRELQKALKRENEDYSRSKDKNEKRRDEDLADETSKYSERLAELKKELAEEAALEKKHADLVSQYRMFPLLDEIEMRQRALTERLAQYNLEEARAKEDSDSQIAAIEGVGMGYDGLTASIAGASDEANDFADKSSSMFKDISTGLAGIVGGWLAYKTVANVVKAAWGAATVAQVGFTASAVTGLGKVALGAEAASAALLAMPWVAVGAAALLAFSAIQNGLDAYQADFDKTLESFDRWQDTIDLSFEKLRENYRSGRISQDEYRKGLQNIMSQQSMLSKQFDDFYNGQFPGWLNWILDRFQTLQNAAKNVISAVSGPSGTPVSSGTANSTPAYFAPTTSTQRTSTTSTTPSLSSYLTTNNDTSTSPFSLSSPTMTQSLYSTSSATPVKYPTSSLEPGMSGSLVTQLQQWLISKGYSIPAGATGYYGDQTKGAVALLQSYLGIAGGQYAGFYGPATLSKLQETYPKGYRTGGVIPGSPDTSVPIIAHGGETVLPYGVDPVTININNPVVRSDEDIRQLAFMVKQVLTSDTKYRHLR